VNEKLLGDFIRKHNVRDKVFSTLTMYLLQGMILITLDIVASKCGFDCFAEGDAKGKVTNSASHIKQYIEGTIERLGFAPDLYYLHRIDPSTSHTHLLSRKLT